jgi:putative peptidoglycan lipid II flippase
VLNTHRRFLVSYTAPIAWNAAMIAALIAFGGGVDLPRLAVHRGVGRGGRQRAAVSRPGAGCFSVAPHLRFALDTASAPVRTVARNFGPVFVSRGVVQISAYIDQLLASLLGPARSPRSPTRSCCRPCRSALRHGRVRGGTAGDVGVVGLEREASAERHGACARGSRPACGTSRSSSSRRRWRSSPSATSVTAAIFETGRFTRTDTVYIWGILAGSSIGLLASTLSRLYVSTYYALGDARTPLNCALVRVVLTTGLGYLFALPLPRLLGLAPTWGAAGLTTSAGIAGLVEMMLLRTRMNARIGRTSLAFGYTLRLWVAALIAAAAAWA